MSTTTMTNVVVGIDVGKTGLDASVDGGAARSFSNDDGGISELVAWVMSQGPALVVCEPTGGFQEPMVQGLRRSGVRVQLVHPVKVRAFAQASGRQAKTDRIDAQALSHYGRVFTASADPPPEAEDEPQRAEVQPRLWRAATATGQSTGPGTEPAGSGLERPGPGLHPTPHRLAG